MEPAEMVALIRGGVPVGDAVWADLGAGTGNFTRALRELLGSSSTIYAVDRDRSAITAQQAHQEAVPGGARLVALQADFTQRLALPPLDGLLMANALHFVREQAAVLGQLVGLLRPGGRVLLVEYELHQAVRWVPFPVPFARFELLAAEVGLPPPTRVGTRRSPSSGIALYAAVAATAPG